MKKKQKVMNVIASCSPCYIEDKHKVKNQLKVHFTHDTVVLLVLALDLVLRQLGD